MRGHPPSIVNKFKGLWNRGDKDTVPLDHFTECNNIRFVSDDTIGVRPGIGISQDVEVPLGNIRRIYNYNNQSANGLLVLTVEQGIEEPIGKIYHVVSATLTYGPILTIEGMTDFAFQPYGGRAYISPFSKSLVVVPPPIAAPGLTLAAGAGVEAGLHEYGFTYVNDEGETTMSPAGSITVTPGNNQVNITDILTGGISVTSRNIYRTAIGSPFYQLLGTLADNVTTVFTDNTPDASLGANVPTTNTATTGDTLVEKGLENEVVYVYAGDGTNARPAAGEAPSGDMTIANGAAGHTDAGLHIFGIVNETISGFLSAPGALEAFTTSANLSVSFGSVPTSGDPAVVRRHLVATKVITGYNGNVEGYDLFFVPGATINNNTDTFLNNVSFFDQDLLDDASHLIDNYDEIPAGAVMGLYHERLIVATTFDDINLVLCSAAGEPEAISRITGIIGIQPDGNPVTNAQELRDVLYLFKRVRTAAYVDNGDEPATWKATIIDTAIGTFVHGVATVLDTGGSSVDFLIVCTYSGIFLFNGRYIDPPLTYKIENTWKSFDRAEFGLIQLVNAPVQEEILVVMPDTTMLVGNYASGMDSKNIAWSPWTFRQGVNTIAIANIDEIIIGSDIN